ncbi:unnamed protein product [Owenia fusiformis]|uniref:Trehalase n=1 Tax=Owenia fusiformis TaxID=6347 RepID=A0A8J1UND2_OWEFU|nr:unnamed protein product [Owenia fusiformis]
MVAMVTDIELIVIAIVTMLTPGGTYRLNYPRECPSPMYCISGLREVIQNGLVAPPGGDFKYFSDMSSKDDLDVIRRAFDELQPRSSSRPLTVAVVEQFINESFEDPSAVLKPWVPSDWTPEPDFLQNIPDSNVKEWAKGLHDLWRDLGRKITDDVKTHPDRHSLIYVPNGIVIPGERFRESYYWDTYWIIKGLLTSGMLQTSRGLTENFVALINKYGFVPNGGRKYYISRSQPPLLAAMVNTIYETTGDIEDIRSTIDALEKEYDFWMFERKKSVYYKRSSYIANVYGFNAKYREPNDEESFGKLTEPYTDNMTRGEQIGFMENYTAACESGWDHSSRWMQYETDDPLRFKLESVRTMRVVPVDLNAYLCHVEMLLSKFYTILGDTSKANYFDLVISDRKRMMQTLFWNEEEGIWFDFDLDKKENLPTDYFYASSFAPLYFKCYDEDSIPNLEERIINYVKKHNLTSYPGGIPVSNQYTGQQWDYPNAWAPMQHMIIEGLNMLNTNESKSIAQTLALTWLKSNYIGWRQTGYMFEKYNATQSGDPGQGGLYKVQKGFGWTNGVALYLINKYKDSLIVPDDVNIGASVDGAATSVIASPVVLITALVASFGVSLVSVYV